MAQCNECNTKWIVWVGGEDYHFIFYQFAKKYYDFLKSEGYGDVVLEEIKQS